MDNCYEVKLSTFRGNSAWSMTTWVMGWALAAVIAEYRALGWARVTATLM